LVLFYIVDYFESTKILMCIFLLLVCENWTCLYEDGNYIFTWLKMGLRHYLTHLEKKKSVYIYTCLIKEGICNL